MSLPKPNSKITLEQLLRLKRAERPTVEFWADFERELHQKQLTALVKKRRWWHGFPAFLLSPRVYLPVSAAAVVAFSFAGIKYSELRNSAQAKAIDHPAFVAQQVVETLPMTVVNAGSAESPDRDWNNRLVSHVNVPAIVDHTEIAQQDLPERHSGEIENSASARSIAANLARLEQAEPELVKAFIGSRLSPIAHVEPAAFTQTDSGSIEPSVSSREYRLIARYADRALSPEPSAPAGVRERIARRLGDDLGEGISRIGVVGSRVSLKF